ncbi:MAG TPA: CBS domain-containing protein [Rubrivivax sp.]|nr:CBS domain-containing protein [Rubrivivax sp.]
MRVADFCTTSTIVCSPATTVASAAQMMRDHHVGDLVVADDSGGAVKPVGILTDRDIVVAVIAQGLDPRAILAGDVMSAQLLTVPGQADPFEAIATMRFKGVSRLPVVDEEGNLAGIVSSADLLAYLTREMAALAGVRHRQQAHEMQARP